MSGLTLSQFGDRITDIMPMIMREFVRRNTGEFLKTKITLPQFIVLDHLHHCRETKMSDLAECMNVSTAAVTGIVDRLVRDKYVVRFNGVEDRRVVNIKLTPSGEAAIKKAIGERKKMIMDVLEVLSQKERAEYLRILTIIKDKLNRMSVQDEK